MKKCYEIKNCPFYTGAVPAEVKCPVYDLKIGCWEYDWVSFYNQMPNSSEKTEWRCGMIEHCKTCEVYFDHKEEMDKIINQLEAN